MVVLTEKSLNERHKELNKKVISAATEKLDFQVAKDEPENTDVDNIFKIELASKYKNIEYIIEILKCGDSLYISRALKCLWVYDDSYSNVINSSYLQHHVFPHMSIKMRKKLLTAISTHVRDEDRMKDFYEYCVRERQENLASKFLNFTSESFKMQLIDFEDAPQFYYMSEEVVKSFFGESFTLLNGYINKHCTLYSKTNAALLLNKLKYLYSVSPFVYLDLIEKYQDATTKKCKFGIRLTRDLLKNHKHRFIDNPAVYIKILHKKEITNKINVNEAKTCLSALLPDEASTFWRDYLRAYGCIINTVPKEEIFQFMKHIFTQKYPKEEFEMSESFYELEHYKYMTASEREAWALAHIESGKEMLGHGNDYKWYQFVTFDKALPEIKKHIMVTPDHEKRTDMLCTLIKSAKFDEEIGKLLQYYYERHRNEPAGKRKIFLDRILEETQVLKYNDNCWNALNKIFHASDVYSVSETDFSLIYYRVIALTYHIMHDINLPQQLEHYIDNGEITYGTLMAYLANVDNYDVEKIYKFYLQYFRNKIEYTSKLDSQHPKMKKKIIRTYIDYIFETIEFRKKSLDDIPNDVMMYIKLNWNIYKNRFEAEESSEEITEKQLMQLLKKDADLVLKKLPSLKERYCCAPDIYMNNLLRKIRIYFSDGIAKEYLKFLKELLRESNPNFVKNIVYGIFQLASHSYKIGFMSKHAPSNAKINDLNISKNLLCIQEAICRLAFYSRPPVPLSSIMLYVKGDYLRYCLPMFNSYLAHLPPPDCLNFVEAVLNSPLSVQKHGLRMAFKCFDASNLKKIVLKVWKNTKNVSLRKILYKELYEKIVGGNSETQRDLFGTLKDLTLTINADDHEDIFTYLASCSKMPKEFLPDFIETAFRVIKGLPRKSVNQCRLNRLIEIITVNILLMKETFLSSIVQVCLESSFGKDCEKDRSKDPASQRQQAQNLDLLVDYVFYFHHINNDVITFIVEHTLKNWDIAYEGTNYLWNFFYFIKSLGDKIKYLNAMSEATFESNVNLCLVPAYRYILTAFLAAMPLEEIYLLVWYLKMMITAGEVITKISQENVNYIAAAIGEYSARIGKLVEELVEQNDFHKYFLQDMCSKITDGVACITCYLGNRSGTIVEEAEANLVLCTELITHFKSPEVCLIVLKLLPKEDSKNDDLNSYEMVLSNVKAVQNKEIQCVLKSILRFGNRK